MRERLYLALTALFVRGSVRRDERSIPLFGGDMSPGHGEIYIVPAPGCARRAKNLFFTRHVCPLPWVQSVDHRLKTDLRISRFRGNSSPAINQSAVTHAARKAYSLSRSLAADPIGLSAEGARWARRARRNPRNRKDLPVLHPQVIASKDPYKGKTGTPSGFGNSGMDFL
jgi:hypothetical protein